MLNYFKEEENMQLLKTTGVVIDKMLDNLNEDLEDEGTAKKLTDNKLTRTINILKDEAHKNYEDNELIRRITKQKSVYRFVDADSPLNTKEIVARNKELQKKEGTARNKSEKQVEILDYLKKQMKQLEGKGIVITDMADQLGFNKNGLALGHAIKELKKILETEDPDSFIHDIINHKGAYTLKKAVVINKAEEQANKAEQQAEEEKKILTYLEDNKELLGGYGIVFADMPKEPEFKNVYVLGKAIGRLKRKLFEDANHFIHDIINKQGVYIFNGASARNKAKAQTKVGEKILAYFKENIKLLEGYGITLARIADQLGFTNNLSLREAIKTLKEKLSGDTGHFIHRVESEELLNNDGSFTFYRFADASIPKEQEIINYFERNIELLEGEGITLVEMTEKLDFSSKLSLQYAINKLQEKLSSDTDHFIHRIKYRAARYSSHVFSYLYRFADANIPKEKEIINYFEENMELLEGKGINAYHMAYDLEFTSWLPLAIAVNLLSERLKIEEPNHFIHRVKFGVTGEWRPGFLLSKKLSIAPLPPTEQYHLYEST